MVRRVVWVRMMIRRIRISGCMGLFYIIVGWLAIGVIMLVLGAPLAFDDKLSKAHSLD